MNNCYVKRKRRNSYLRKNVDRRKLKKLYEETSNSCLRGAYYDEDKERIIKYKASPNAWRYWKKICSRKARRYFNSEEAYSKGKIHKKATELIWMVI